MILQSPIDVEIGIANFWKQWQEEAEPCIFPTLVQTELAEASHAELSIELGKSEQSLHGLVTSGLHSRVEVSLVTAWAIVLKAYTSNASISLGLTNALTGPFPSARLCSLSIDRDDKVSSLSRMVQTELFGSDRYQTNEITSVPLFWTADGRPFCNTALSLGLRSAPLHDAIDIAVDFEITPQQVTARLSYSRQCLDESQAADLAATFSEVLNSSLENPNTTYSELSLVHQSSLTRLFTWNQSVPASIDKCVGDLFYEQSQERPGNIAVHSSDAQLSYTELEVATNKLAHALQARGVGPETIVLLCFPKSAWAVVAMIAVIRAGGTMLFFDASHPTARLQEIQAQVQSKIMLTCSQYEEMWDWTGAEVLIVDQSSVDALPSPTTTVTTSVTPSNMLYIIFTSGSTGRPKGCIIEHRQFLTGSFAQRKASGMQHTDRVLQLASFTFDVSILEIITSLITGACVCIPGDASRAKGPASCIEEFGVTWAFLTPSLVKLMTPEMVPSLRFLVLGGEPLGRTDVETWAPQLQLANGYGPTECSIAATAYPKLSSTTDPANIGFPLGALCWIVDPEDHRRLVPPGAPGELLVHGPIVARGYFQDPVKTADAFVDDFPWLPPQRFGHSRLMYKTGDLARYNSDGTIHFLGRKDSQVKLRGLRIELGEIEHHIAVNPLVRQAVVLLPRQGPCKNQLTVVLCLKEGFQEIDSEKIELLDPTLNLSLSKSLDQVIQDASDHLPAYMLPSIWVLAKSIPLTISGKLHRVYVTKWTTGMSEPMYNQITGAEAAIQASNPVEETIQRLCSEVLDMPLVRIHLNRSFVNNGGDSISGMQLLAKLRAESIKVSVKDMIESKTLTELAQRASNGDSHEVLTFQPSYDRAAFDTEILPQLPFSPDQIQSIYSLGPMQRGILLSQQRGSGSYEFRIVCEISTTNEVDLDRLATAWKMVVHRHDSLRTIFVPSISEDSPYDQLVLEHVEPYINVIPCKDKVTLSRAVRAHKIVASDKEPRVNLIVYETSGTIYCMAAIDHALIDGVSVLLMFRDLSAAYAETLDATQQMHFSHYVGYLQQLEKSQSLEYWKQYLNDLAPCHFPLLNDEADVADELHEISNVLELGMELQQFCRDHNLTPASLVQTAWALTLRSYTGLDDVCFGYLSAGRDAPVADIEDAVGAYINMLVCRLKLDSSRTLKDLVDSVQEGFLNSMSHQHCSLAEIQHALELREPLFNTVMSLQSALGEVISAPNVQGALEFRIVDEVDPTEYDISVNVAISREAMHLNIRHYTSKISKAAAGRVFETFKYMLETIVKNHAETLIQTIMISDHDRDQIVLWNARDWQDYRLCVHEQIAHQVVERPDTTAIVAWDGSLTYRELDHLSTLLASHLSTLAVGPEVLVPLSFKKSMWVPVTQLAVLKAGGACVAFDPAHPTKRREELLRQCDAKVAITSPIHGHLFQDLVEKVVIVDEALFKTLAHDKSRPSTWEKAGPNNPAFVVFTSGSTGKPKGIVLEHHALVTSAHAHGPTMKYQPGNRILQFASYTFDVSIGETFSGLMLGATLCIPNDEERMDDLAGVINRMDVNVAYLTPSVASVLHPDDVPGLEVLALGGEAVRAENIARWADRVYLVNIYGPAECSVWSTGLYPVPPKMSPANIGFGLGARMWITQVGRPDQLCAIGCVGELLIEGPIVARGYLNDIEKTTAAFISSPKWIKQCGYDSSNTIYRTGDLARYNTDGSIFFIGRRDFQIKLHGQRIEMGEIEHNMLSHDSVANAVVIYPKAGAVSQRLVAVVALGEHAPTEGDNNIKVIDPQHNPAAAQQVISVRAHLSERVPVYMMPAIWIVVQTIPLSVNGKTDRSAVSRFIEALEHAPEQIAGSTSSTSVALPAGQAERTLRSVISIVLGINEDSISMDQTFVALGGDSITAMQLSARCRSNAMLVTVKEILLSKSLRQLANSAKQPVQGSLSNRKQDDTGAFTMLADSDVELVDQQAKAMKLTGLQAIEDAYPVSPMQQGILVAQAQTSSAYKFHVVCKVKTTTSDLKAVVRRLNLAWQKVVNRHPILRTIFIESGSKDGLYVQMVLKDAIARTMFVETMEELLGISTSNPIDYDDKQPPHRFTLCETEGVVFFNLEISHTLIDGASMAVILKDLAAAYQSSLIPAPSYRDYISLLQDQAPAESLSHWSQYLHGVEPSVFPSLIDNDRASRTLEAVKVSLPNAVTRSLQEFSKAHGVTLANVLQTAWGLVVRTYSGSTDVLFGFLASGRDVPLESIEDAVGPFINMLVCRVNASKDVSVLEAVKKTQSDYLDSLPHQHTSLSEIQHSLGLRSTRLFNTILSLQRPMAEAIDAGSEIDIEYLQGSDPTEYDLSVNITASDSVIDVSISYWSTFLSGERAAQVASTFAKCLSEMLAYPDASFGELNFLDQDQMQQIFSWNNDGNTPVPVDGLIHANVLRHAAERPEAIAISAWDGTLTFSQLDDLSGRLAHYLRSLGVRPENIVPLCFDKSRWTIVSMMAVLRAGAAYASMDPSHPAQHLGNIVKQTEAKLVLTGSATYAEKLHDVVSQVEVINQDLLHQLPAPPHVPSETSTPDSAAFICFTSGSTGKPKAICLTHRSFTSMVASNTSMGIGPQSRVFQFAAYTFDTSNSEIFTTLTSGGCVCVPSESERLNDPADVMNRLEVDWTFLTPSMASMLTPADIPLLRTLALGGEQVRDDIVDLWKEDVRVLNSYGPAECTIWTSMAELGHGNSPATISSGNGGNGSLLWIADIADVDKLAPIGVVGELLIEGPILARGYLDSEKTRQAFIPAPRWRGSSSQPIRLYRSGDLARYHSDGTLIYMGRSDGQVKLNGQRIEMGEIEKHIAASNLVRYAVVLLPKHGICKRKLVAVVAPAEHVEKTIESRELSTIQEKERKETAASQVALVKEQLSGVVPGYMVPSVWLIAQSVPLTASKKVDRVRIARWVDELSNETYNKALDVEEEQQDDSNVTDGEKRLQQVIATVLNVPTNQIHLNKSFLNLGGDSILAMQLVVQARKEGMKLTVKDVMRSKTLSSLSLTAQAVESGGLVQNEIYNVPFELSPIQSMYFEDLTKGSTDPTANQFNQSFLLEVSQKQKVDQVSESLQQIVDNHAMLRARYIQGVNGVWQQLVLPRTAGTYRFETHNVDSREQALSIAEQSQQRLHIENGPVFSASLFNLPDGSQLLFMVAHHLVIDLVSWRIIIRQLEELLTLGGMLPTAKPFPFHSWVQAQADYSRRHLQPEKSLLHIVPTADYSYWGMDNVPNVRGTTTESSFTLEAAETDLLLRGCHTALKTEPLDIFLSAAFQSFAKTFARSPPAIFTEGHGREPWDNSIDITETVGWFTTLFPLHAASDVNDSALDTVKTVKDQRRFLPQNGWAYFNSASSNDAGKEAFAAHRPIEILFNYLGIYQGQGQSSSLLQAVPFNKGDVGPGVSRFALIEINAYVLDGKAHFSITHSTKMQRQELIGQWVAAYRQCLMDIGQQLQTAERTLTSGDYPNLITSNVALQRFQEEALPSITSIDNVEDIFAVSPMQEGILLSQNRMQGAYQIETVVEISSLAKKTIDVERFASAWQQVVHRHATLRTVFIQKLSDRPYDQLVVKAHAAKVSVVHSQDEDALAYIQSTDNLVYNSTEAPHRLELVQAPSGRTYAKLEISHALVDGTSMSVLIGEWVEAYNNSLSALPGPLYSDYIAYIQSQPRHAALDYWKHNLADVRTCHFPVLTDNQIEPERLLHEVEVRVPNAALLRDFCQQNNITLASIFRLAWAKVLRAFTGDDQVCFGYLASGREIPVPGIESAVGAFINMLVCSINFDAIGQQKVVNSLESLQDEYLRSLPFQHISLAQIQHELGMSGQTLFNSVLSFQRRSHGDFKVGDIMLRYLDGVDPTEYDISVSISDSQDGVFVNMSYYTSRLSDGQAANVASALSNVLSAILQSSNTTVGALGLSGNRDASQIELWNAEPFAPINKCVHEMFQQSARLTPDAIAIDSFDGTMTYEEVETKSTQLAQALIKRGVQMDSLIPIAFEKSAWAIIAMLGIMKAGAGYVPLDPAHPDDRLRTIVGQTEAVLVIVSESTAQRMEGLFGEVLRVSPTSSLWSSSVSTDLKTGVTPADVAYVLFTSGSTGVPKGVVLSHVAVSSSTFHHGAEIGCSAATRMYQFAAYTFDACILEIFTTLAYGGCICVPSDAERMSDIAGFITRKQVNTSFMTPSLVRILSPEQIPTMKTLILGGEALGQDNIGTWAPQLKLMNGYGPTETCVFAVMKTFKSPQDRNDILGKGVGSQTWIVSLDDPSQLAAVGTIGMLCLSGPALARGYLNDKTKTDSVFIDDAPFLPRVEGMPRRAYNTGDLARYNSDGSITYLGRRDQQVKLRGQRIELAEIEHHTKASFPRASQVGIEVVLPLGQKERTTLAAFLCLPDREHRSTILLKPDDGLRSDLFKLQKSLESLLPPYEVPTLYIPVRRMLTTTAGKLDRKALRDAIAALSEEELDNFSLAEASKKPLSTDSERATADMWSAVLRIPVSKIGADDNFFRLGGDSITAMRLAAMAGAEFTLTVADIFQHPVLTDMAALAKQDYSETNGTAEIRPFDLLESPCTTDMLRSFATKCDVSVEQVEDAYPCSPLQEGMMVLSILNPGAYMVQKVFELPSTMDIARFRKAWELAIANNAILRTTIIQTESGRSLQVVLSNAFQWRTASTLQEYLLQDQQDEAACGKPLSRYAITKDGYFVWTAHHSMYDGWTVPLILEQVHGFYTAGQAPATPSFNTFVKYLSKTSYHDGQAYWNKYLSGGKPVSFPEQPSASHVLRVDHDSHHSMSISRRPGSSIPMATILRAAWAYTLAQYSDAEDVVFGMTLSGRNCPVHDIAKILGPTITTVPIRVAVPTEGTVAEFLSTVQEDSNKMIPFEHFGLQNIGKISHEASRAVQFQNIFVVQPMAQFDVHHNELLGAEEVSTPLKNFDTYPLVMECSLSDSEVHFEARFDANVIAQDRMDRIIRHFEHVIKSFNSATQTTRMQDISMFTEDDMTQILEWNKTYPDVLETTVPEVFAEQVKLRPDALAVDAWDGQLTYAELDRLSSVFAAQLVKQGVGAEVLVPLCFEKSRWAIVTQMSVIKAGGGVVNLDSAHPLGRLELIIEDAKAKVILVAPQFYDKFKGVVGLKVISIDEQYFRNLSEPSKPKLPPISPSSVAYVLFTSGSTGRPKGIVIEHRSLCSSSKAHGTAWDIGPETRLLQFAAYTFDVSCADNFTTLQRGGCICVPSEHDRLNNLAGAINHFQCNWAFLTPTVASLLPAHGIPSLRKLVLGGEASTRDTIAKWHNVLDLIVCYGPAECSVYCSGAPPATATSDPADLGEAIGALYWIADPQDYNRLVPVGCTGELLLEGPTVARGYLHDKEKTANAFIANPSWATGGSTTKPRRFYRTGDLVRFNGDGTIHFVGRKDTQVKVRGQRVELGEIEHAIRLQMPSLAHVTVDAVRQASLDDRQVVVAYLHMTTEGGAAKALPLEGELKEDLLKLQSSLSEALPSYMLPNLFIPMAHVPLTMNGKADRRQLRDLASGMSREQVLAYGLESTTKQAPTTPMEHALRDLWASALGVDPEAIGIEDQFFRVGGDSILAMKLVGVAGEQGIPLSVRDFFKSPVLAEMAKVVESRSKIVTNGAAPKYEPFSLFADAPPTKLVKRMAAQLQTPEANIADILPATDFQQNAVAHALMKTRGFRNYLWLDGYGELDAAATKKALGQFVGQHEILRTIFGIYHEKFVQVVLKKLDFAVDIHETDQEIAAFTEQICRKDSAKPTKATDPLLKFFIIKARVDGTSSSCHRIVMRISHAQYDGVCLPKIWASLASALANDGSITPNTRPMAAYMSALASQNHNEALQYWRSLLANSHMTPIVTHPNKPSFCNVYNTFVRRVVPTSTLSAQHGITFATILKAAWALVLASLSHTPDVTFGHVVSGRNLDAAFGPGLDNVIGGCINIVPVRVAALRTAESTILQLLQAVQDQHAASLPYESVGSRTIVREASPWPKQTRFSSVVQHQNIEEDSTVAVGGRPYEVGFWCPEADEADLAVKTTPLKDGTTEVLMICSDTAVGEEARAKLMDRLCELIGVVGGDVEARVGDVLERSRKSDGGERLLPLPAPPQTSINGAAQPITHSAAAGANSNGSVASRIRGWEAMQKLQQEQQQQPAANTTRQALASAWHEVLQLHKEDTCATVSDDESDFFALGGDLVAAAVLAAKLAVEGIGEREVSVEEVIEGSRFGEMVRVLGG
ncbi:uncharacterized protein HMPREF1541_03025 [Cyphellophora europaea CBS 101466]|uniref:Carrier domain-containing protein n=1 Tax=Cyphellophora europaea (strain CBS 101466) TaxID=1220924 RepID=W2RXP1_CYPE1|nr:uncharacterized protein HMPREF1541_03025 [Cyphellophora europaea CBS 101466]ETN41090.1 hypothetical protein HMPREF1541_03025 [Cyphellophora europaea CBS 101466]